MITIELNGKKYTKERITLVNYKKALEIKKKLQETTSDDEVETLDIVVAFIVDLYENQFTFDDVMIGIEVKDIEDVLFGQVSKCLGK